MKSQLDIKNVPCSTLPGGNIAVDKGCGAVGLQRYVALAAKLLLTLIGYAGSLVDYTAK